MMHYRGHGAVSPSCRCIATVNTMSQRCLPRMGTSAFVGNLQPPPQTELGSGVGLSADGVYALWSDSPLALEPLCPKCWVVRLRRLGKSPAKTDARRLDCVIHPKFRFGKWSANAPERPLTTLERRRQRIAKRGICSRYSNLIQTQSWRTMPGSHQSRCVH